MGVSRNGESLVKGHEYDCRLGFKKANFLQHDSMRVDLTPPPKPSASTEASKSRAGKPMRIVSKAGEERLDISPQSCRIQPSKPLQKSIHRGILIEAYPKPLTFPQTKTLIMGSL